MNMQESMNQSLLKEVKHLRKKFEKISDKYQEKKTISLPFDLQQSLNAKSEQKRQSLSPAGEPQTPEPNPPQPQPQQQKPQLQASGKNRQGQYVRAKRLNLLDF
jgi:hypothetical protein